MVEAIQVAGEILYLNIKQELMLPYRIVKYYIQKDMDYF
ncbi:MAG: hypothetical protein ACI8ZX_000151 [Planctomycetota bacterium]|jgi:hypothetical protein